MMNVALDKCVYILLIILVVRRTRHVDAASRKLDDFQKALDKVRSQLMGIKDCFSLKNPDVVRQRRGIDEMLMHFQVDVNFADQLERTMRKRHEGGAGNCEWDEDSPLSAAERMSRSSYSHGNEFGDSLANLPNINKEANKAVESKNQVPVKNKEKNESNGKQKGDKRTAAIKAVHISIQSKDSTLKDDKTSNKSKEPNSANKDKVSNESKDSTVNKVKEASSQKKISNENDKSNKTEEATKSNANQEKGQTQAQDGGNKRADRGKKQPDNGKTTEKKQQANGKQREMGCDPTDQMVKNEQSGQQEAMEKPDEVPPISAAERDLQEFADMNELQPNNWHRFGGNSRYRPHSRYCVLPDNIEQNDLSHEADYKLSKLEQEAIENKRHSARFPWTRQQQQLQQLQRQQRDQPLDDSVKRNPKFNAMNEIKLRTIQRLMGKGFGPLLPSSLAGGLNRNFFWYDPKDSLMCTQSMDSDEVKDRGDPKNYYSCNNLARNMDQTDWRDDYKAPSFQTFNPERFLQYRKVREPAYMRDLPFYRDEQISDDDSLEQNIDYEEIGEPFKRSFLRRKYEKHNRHKRSLAKTLDPEKNVNGTRVGNKRENSGNNLQSFKANSSSSPSNISTNSSEHELQKRSIGKPKVFTHNNTGEAKQSRTPPLFNENSIDAEQKKQQQKFQKGIERAVAKKFPGIKSPDNLKIRKPDFKEFTNGNVTNTLTNALFGNNKKEGKGEDSKKDNNEDNDNKVDEDKSLDGAVLRKGDIFSSNSKSPHKGKKKPKVHNEYDTKDGQYRQDYESANEHKPEPEDRHESNKPNKQGTKLLVVSLNDQVANCSASSKTKTDLKDPDANATQHKTPNHKTDVGAGSSGGNSTAKDKIEIDAHKRDDLMKVNIAINGCVTTNNSGQHFFGNGTINVHPPDDRERRDTLPRNNGNVLLYADNMEDEYGSEQHNLRADQSELDSAVRQSVQIVKSIFEIIPTHPTLKVLWPSLKRDRRKLPQQSEICSNSGSNNRVSRMQNVERLLREAMGSVSDIIENEVSSRICIPLNPELRGFYEMILDTYAKRNQYRERRSAAFNMPVRLEDDIFTIQPSNLASKVHIVKKLLKQYECLSDDEKEQVRSARDDLLLDLLYLRKLSEGQEALAEQRRRRDLYGDYKNNLGNYDSEAMHKFESQYTPEFLKLFKASERFNSIY